MRRFSAVERPLNGDDWATINNALADGENVSIETPQGPMVLGPRDPRDVPEDAVESGLEALAIGHLRPEALLEWAERELGGPLRVRGTDGSPIAQHVLVEAAWKVLRTLEPPTATCTRELVRTVYALGGVTFVDDLWVDHAPPIDPDRPETWPEPLAIPRFWKEEPESVAGYLRDAIANKARQLHALYEQGLADRSELEVDRDAVAHLAKDRPWEREGTERLEPRQTDEGEVDPVDELPGGEIEPVEMALRAYSRFVADDRERMYLELLARGATKAEAQAQAQLPRSRALALEARIRRSER